MSYQVRNTKRAKQHGRTTPRWQIVTDTERGPCLREPDRSGPGTTFSTLEVLRAYCDTNNIGLYHADEYGEPGYTNPPEGRRILFADWNDVPATLQDRLERQGYELEWSDEWYFDSGRSPAKAWRTQPDDMSWEPRIKLVDGDILTPDDDPDDWIAESLNEESDPLPSWFSDVDLRRHGFEKSNEDYDVSNPLRNVPRGLRREGYEFVLRSTRSREYEVWTRKRADQGVLFNSASGIYIPQRFAREVDRYACEIPGMRPEDWDVLEYGPEHEQYWDVWQDVSDKCLLTIGGTGKKYRLRQDGDVFYVEEGAEYCEYLDDYFVHKE